MAKDFYYNDENGTLKVDAEKQWEQINTEGRDQAEKMHEYVNSQPEEKGRLAEFVDENPNLFNDGSDDLPE